jgi:membrane protease YdiL (CAAX protease family)
VNDTSATAYRWPAIAAYLAVWTTAFLFLRSEKAFQPQEALAGLVILGLIFPALALLATRRAVPLAHMVRRPPRETALLIGYLAVIAAVLVAGFGRVAQITAEPLHSVVLLAVKLATFVVAPAALVALTQGYRLRELMPVSLCGRDLRPALWMSLAAILMQCVLGRGLRDLSQAHVPVPALLLGIPLSFAWLIVEVGVVEEFFFRALLQSRLAAALRSEWAGLVIAGLSFGLVHAPGFYLRPAATMETLGANPSLLMAVGYSLAMTSLAGLFLGILWMRTRNFAVVVIVHAAGDLLPNLLPFLRDFHLIH